MSGWRRLWVKKVDVVLSPQAASSAPLSASSSSSTPQQWAFGGGSAAGADAASSRQFPPFCPPSFRTNSSFCQWHFNDDLIASVFGFLGNGQSYRQAAVLSLVCKDWRSCVRFHSSFWTSLDVREMPLPRANVEDELVEGLLQRCSDLVQTVTIRDCLYLTQRSVLGIANHCPNLISLDIESVGSYLLCDLTASVVEVIDRCRNLQHLNLSSCPNLAGVAVRHLAAQAPGRIRSLRLRNNARLSCEDLFSLRCCSALRVLDIGGCSLVRDRTIMALSRSNQDLRVLNIAACALLTDGAVKAALEHCKQLECLDMCDLPLVTKFAFQPLALRRWRWGAGAGNSSMPIATRDSKKSSNSQTETTPGEQRPTESTSLKHKRAQKNEFRAAASLLRKGQNLKVLRFSLTRRMSFSTARALKTARPDIKIVFVEPRLGELRKRKAPLPSRTAAKGQCVQGPGAATPGQPREVLQGQQQNASRAGRSDIPQSSAVPHAAGAPSTRAAKLVRLMR
eukprot:INCI1212.1.p1 GENE.INCI1212.1~~INCI1212.1.p1  ORF type:complete len:508 (+),score=80.27 INCI1212.1:214-1737(+)